MKLRCAIIICLLWVCWIGESGGATGNAEDEVKKEKRQSYIGGNQGNRFYVTPPLSPIHILTDSLPTRHRNQPLVVPGRLEFHKRLKDVGLNSMGYTNVGGGFPHQSQLLATHPQHQLNADGGYGTSGCSGSFPCVPLVYCAPFFEEVRRSHLGCQFGGEAFGACCRAPGQGDRGLGLAAAISDQDVAVGFSQMVGGQGFAAFPSPQKMGISSGGGFSGGFSSPGIQQGLFSSSAVAEAMGDLEKREKEDKFLQEQGIVLDNPQNPSFGHLQFFKTSLEALNIAQEAIVQLDASRVMETSSQRPLQGDFGSHIGGFGGGFSSPSVDEPVTRPCAAPRSCGYKEKFFRTINGACNNLIDSRLGQSLTSFARITTPRYVDRRGEPRRSITGSELPSARRVSTANVPDVDNPSSEYTLAVMQWGQFIDHDLTHAPIFRFDNQSGIECCDERGQPLTSNQQHPACFLIDIPEDDHFYSQFGRRCMNFVRSLPAPLPNCTGEYREQMNQNTHFLDGSAVYGSMEAAARELRLGRNGLLKTQRAGLLPGDPNASEEECFLAGSGLECFQAGDSRVNEQPHLSVIHTVWVRQHNRIAMKLSQLNPHWSDDRLFEEARKIVVAQIQHIVYNEWLPLILGANTVERAELLPFRKGFSAYDQFLDPRIRNEFATVAFRFGHTLVQGMLRLFDKYHKKTENLELFRFFNRPGLIYQSKKIDQLLRGLSKQPMQSFDNFVVDDLTNRLFQTDEVPHGLDLVALNTQRGRDHGIPSYNDLREVCGLPRARTFYDLRDFVNPESIAVFKHLYASVDDIDAFVAGISERPFNGGIVGPLFNCIIRDQFARLKFGDRFFYEHGGMKSSFTEAQLHEIRKTSWAEIVCLNSEHIKHVQPLAFRLIGPKNPKVSCSSPAIPKMSCNPWIERPHQY